MGAQAPGRAADSAVAINGSGRRYVWRRSRRPGFIERGGPQVRVYKVNTAVAEKSGAPIENEYLVETESLEGAVKEALSGSATRGFARIEVEYMGTLRK